MTREENINIGLNMKHSPAGGITAPLSSYCREWVVWFEFCEVSDICALVRFEPIIQLASGYYLNGASVQITELEIHISSGALSHTA